MVIRRCLYIAVFITAIILQFQFSKDANAQGSGIAISPVRIEDIVEPGQVLKKQLKVTNEAGISKTFYVYLRDFKAEGESGRPKLIAPGSEKGYFLASWIDITQEGIPFGPGEEKIIDYLIKVPSNVGPGGYYGAILFGTKPPRLFLESEDKGAGMSIAQQTGSLLLLQVKGDVDEDAIIREFNTDKDFYSTPFNIKFLIRIENRGNVHVKPKGTINIENMFGKEVGKIVINEKNANILPISIRRFETIWEGENGFGRYNAKLGMTYGVSPDKGGQGKQTLYTEKYFWIIPWKIIIPSLLGIVFIGALFILLLKLYKNKAVRKAMQKAGLGHIKYVEKFKGSSPTLHLGVILLIVFIVLFLIIGMIFILFFA